MLRMKMTRNTSSSENSTIRNVVGLLDPMCLFVLSASALRYEVLLCLVLVGCWQANLLMIYNRSLTQWSCLFIVTISLFVGWFITDANLGDVIAIIDVLFSPIVHQLRCSVDLVVLSSVQHGGKVAAVFRWHPWLWQDLSAMDYVRFFSLLTRLLWYESMEFSTLQKLLWFVPSYLDWVVARRRIDTCSTPLVRASGKKDTD